MEYRLVITEHAEELLDNLIYYLLYKLKNEQAAKHLLNGVENVYERNETKGNIGRNQSCIVRNHPRII